MRVIQERVALEAAFVGIKQDLPARVCQDQVEMSANHQFGMSPDHQRKCPLAHSCTSFEIRQGWPPPPRSLQGAWPGRGAPESAP
jgi:hypothetical protein